MDGEARYIPDIPFVADEIGGVCNLLDVNVSKYSSLILRILLLNGCCHVETLSLDIINSLQCVLSCSFGNTFSLAVHQWCPVICEQPVPFSFSWVWSYG